ncbi:acetyl-CoA carboxylase, carboxyltransferase subunit beta [Varunaivibrio sulfuroxidans]|uniref:Acetyl-coenzyme A carboxylase carboxyl transferase subunit beta n=1 Tax=Varunaivibrio sulfuroxidans TaxID=1773489 RepID=A0A4R3J839_9PROT|nr:acetyl-CoA carboxylase, carboxyltransferase subunit beta [Varunaivibrio sulfuroxidans]TCS61637.1 acetyl-CoA carboxylase carboxyltransferase subunit alpha [Varunaivibrio sulfuroxidans]WES29491.1 acetyl-CoA carboxylase, carboxyltransferase subunit beta [Varunaivibrio sulfuroxidans]
MNWLINFVRPKLKELVGGQKEIPDNLWRQCPACQQMIFHRDLEANLHVCQHCGHHLRIGVRRRLELLFDDGAYDEAEYKAPLNDPLKFRDLKKYSDRLRDARAKTGEDEALIVAHGKMGGNNVVIAAFNFAFMGGSMSAAVGEGIVTAARLAVLQDATLIIVPASGGARMQEGILSLMQMARTTIAIEEVKEAGLPYIVLLSDPTTGGVLASFAMLGDIHIAEPGSQIGFAGARVIEQTIREKLPEGFQRAEYLYEHGMVDMVTPRAELRDTLVRVISILRNPAPMGNVLALEKGGA